MGTTLYHWTSRDAMKLILASKKLELEGTEYMAGLREGYSIADQRALDDQYNYCGRFVWFTESPSYNFSGKVKIIGQGIFSRHKFVKDLLVKLKK